MIPETNPCLAYDKETRHFVKRNSTISSSFCITVLTVYCCYISVLDLEEILNVCIANILECKSNLNCYCLNINYNDKEK